MGVRNGIELGRSRVQKNLTTAGTTPATGIAAGFFPQTNQSSASGGRFNFSVWGTFVATVVLEKTFDGGTTWIQAADQFGDAVSLTAPGTRVIQEMENGVEYRARASAYTSGTATVRMSQ